MQQKLMQWISWILLGNFVVGTIPEVKNGVTGLHIFAMMTVEKHCSKFELCVIGHCTDSASNSLRYLQH